MYSLDAAGCLLSGRLTFMVAVVFLRKSSAMFIRLIIRTFQLVFSVGIVFFSHNKSANSVSQPAYQHSRTGPKRHIYFAKQYDWMCIF
jgi:hypothetical protein